MFERTHVGRLALLFTVLIAPACSTETVLDRSSAGNFGLEEGPSEEVEALSRTEFTDRIENFFEYDPLRAGQPSQFLIHLTDLESGAPVAQAQVDLTVRSARGSEVTRVRALVGRVAGIYVAELTIPDPGTYVLGFQVVSDRLEETMHLAGFEVE